MKRSLALAVFAAILLAGCAAPGPQATPSTGSGTPDAARQLRVAAAAERGGQIGMALSLYATLSEANPGDPEVAQRHGAALLQAGQPQRAREVLAEARRRNPTTGVLMQAEARALLELGQAAEALALFDAHLQASPGDARSLNGRGIALDLLGRHAEARMAYGAARQADPNSPLSTGNLALSLMLSGCADAAMAVLEASPRNASTAEWLGQMQGLARTLSPAGAADAETAALRRALPSSAEPCTATL
ncbi:MAG TPA: tetratricopeptide repeat protein [Falsiroseomonas sp.]|jgi:Flp pilus assembly protein TadD|nr:tetratricopeptide repeat protein [Falsiroseomonas sp.]